MLLFHCNYGYANATQNNFISSLLIFLPGALRGMGEKSCVAHQDNRVEGAKICTSQ